jgi:hypothetical protein
MYIKLSEDENTKIGDIITVSPDTYWLREDVDSEKYGQAFEITTPTKCKIIGARDYFWEVENLEPIRSEGRLENINITFNVGEMKLLVPKKS